MFPPSLCNWSSASSELASDWLCLAPRSSWAGADAADSQHSAGAERGGQAGSATGQTSEAAASHISIIMSEWLLSLAFIFPALESNLFFKRKKEILIMSRTAHVIISEIIMHSPRFCYECRLKTVASPLWTCILNLINLTKKDAIRRMINKIYVSFTRTFYCFYFSPKFSLNSEILSFLLIKLLKSDVVKDLILYKVKCVFFSVECLKCKQNK